MYRVVGVSLDIITVPLWAVSLHNVLYVELMSVIMAIEVAISKGWSNLSIECEP